MNQSKSLSPELRTRPIVPGSPLYQLLELVAKRVARTLQETSLQSGSVESDSTAGCFPTSISPNGKSQTGHSFDA